MAIMMLFDAERKSSPNVIVDILRIGYDKYPAWYTGDQKKNFGIEIKILSFIDIQASKS